MAEPGIPSVYLEHQLSHDGASKKTHGSIIERLRHKHSQTRSWTDSIKSVRSFVAERRMQTEKTEPSGVQEYLDTLQKTMKVISQQTLTERLDLIGRQLGLNTEIQDQKVTLGMDEFTVEVQLGDGGSVVNVKLTNQGDVIDCPDLRDVLIKGDFKEFTEHLQGLQSIYQVTNDVKLKSKAFLALQALEKDLNQLAQFQSSISGVANYVHKCPLGIMLPRLAGKPLKLIYFVSPYDLLDKKSLTAHPLTVEAITEHFLGQSVTVCIESVPDHAPANKLQTMPLMNVNKTQDGKSQPSFSQVNNVNSVLLPACFVLVLPQSMPVSVQILQKITSQTGLEIHNESDSRSLCGLILESFSEGQIKDCKDLFVSLPDQQHIYFIDGLTGRSPEQQGVMVSRIPFTHPTHVPQILNFLRQQLLFNIVIASCIRPGAKKDTSNSIVFEITAVSLQQLTIVFEHPAYDSMITVDVDLSDITNLKCRVSCTNTDQELCSDDSISRVFQRCMSIPIMLRWLIGKGLGHLDKLKEAALAAEREREEKALFLKEMQHRQVKLQPTTLPANRPPPQPPHPPPLPPPPSYTHHHHSPMHLPQGQLTGNGQIHVMYPALAEPRNNISVLEDFHQMAEGTNRQATERLLMPVDDEPVHNPLLTTLLDEEKMTRSGSLTETHDSPMLSRLLDDNTSVATTVIPMNCKITRSPPVKRQRKRRLPSEFSGPRPKHRVSDTDSSDHLGMLGSPMDLDMGPAVMDHMLSNTPSVMGSMTPTHGSSSYHHHHPLLNHASKAPRPQSSVIDLTEVNMVGESSLKKLADSVDKHFIHKDVKSEPDLSMLFNETETPNRIPNILQNSPSGSKNENASTSLEGYLKGSGEVGRANDFDPSDASSVHNSTTFSKLSSLLLASSDIPASNLSISSHKANSTFFSDKLGGEEAFGASVGKSVLDGIFPQDIKPSPASLRKGALHQSSSVELPIDQPVSSGLFEKFDIPRQQQNIKTEAALSEVKSQPVEGKVSLKLRVGSFKQQNNVKPYVKAFNSVDETDLVYGKSNSIGTFDFKSDEDEDDTLMQLPSDRYVYPHPPSPTRLHVSSNKHKRLNDYAAIPQKSDKTRKKDKSSGSVAKRKREKDESKREKKRKKSEHFIQESVYRTVENDTKADFKLKIRVAKKPVSDRSGVLSDGKVPSYEIKKRSLSCLLDKSLPCKQEDKESEPIANEHTKEKNNFLEGSNATKSIVSKLVTTVHKSSLKSGSSKSVHNSGSVNKTDPKLVTKATIKLKPLIMPGSGSTVNIGQSAPKTSSSLSTSNRTDRRNSAALTAPVSEKRSSTHNSLLERRSSSSNSVDRRSASQSSSSQVGSSSTALSANSTAAVTPTTTANLSLSSILPNAPTTSKIANLPRIPKLSSSSNTSINRTSSLDPASGSVPTSAGTKSNNSYTVGPAGRPNLGATSGPGGNRSAGSNSTFNYNNRPAGPGTGVAGSNRPNFSGSRLSGPAQTSHLVNSSQSGSQRPSDPRTHNAAVTGNIHRAGSNPVSSHKSSGQSASSAVKGSLGNSNSPTVSLKTYSGGAKVISISSKINNFQGQKPNSTVKLQRHSSQNSVFNNSMRTSSSSSIACKSPNTPGLTKSPNSGKSPNITHSGKSPNITHSGKSPNITNSGKSPSLNSASKSPNVSAANKSPNISSSSSGRSPSISSNRSPSVGNSIVRPSPSPHSSKSPVSHRHSSSMSKHSNVNRSNSVVGTIRSHSSSSPSQRSVNSISGSNKTSKTEMKTTVTSSSALTSSNSQRLGNGKSVSASHASTNISIKVPSTSTALSSSSSLPAAEAPVSTSPAQKSVTAEHQIASTTSSFPVTSVTSSPSSSILQLPLSPGKSNSNDVLETTQDIKGSKIHSMAVEVPSSSLPVKLPVSISSVSNTAPHTDSVKTLFTSPSCRGRKNSLSAIVDKLKNTAVGSVTDPVVVMPAFSDSLSNVTCNNPINSESKLDLKTTDVFMPYGKQEETIISSPVEPATNNADTHSFTMDKTQNCVLENEHIKSVCEQSNGGNLDTLSFPSAKYQRSQISDTLISVQGKIPDSTCQDVSCLPDNEYRLELRKGTLVSSKDKSIQDNTDIKKEKPAPLKIPLSQQSLPSLSPVQSSAMNSSMSPQSSPFQPLQSPCLIKNTTPIIGPGCASVCKILTDSSEQTFKIPSLKAGNDNQCDENKPPVPEVSPEPQTDRSDCAGYVHENSYCDENTIGDFEKNAPSSKPLSSPLSDISSPENGLIIADEESQHLASKSSARASKTKPVSANSSADKTSSSHVQGDVSAASPNLIDWNTVGASPKTGYLSYIKSPTLSKSSSGTSVPKECDSPCPIDDDLMDMALGFGS